MEKENTFTHSGRILLDVAVETLKREGYYDGLAKKMGMDDPSLTEIEIEERTPLVFRVQDIADRIKDN